METPSEREQGKISASLVVGVIIAVVLLMFVFSNLGEVRVHFLWMDFGFPGFILFLLTVLAGVAIDRIFQWWWPRRKAKRASN
jgi:uncharacterized integral membrane protein